MRHRPKPKIGLEYTAKKYYNRNIGIQITHGLYPKSFIERNDCKMRSRIITTAPLVLSYGLDSDQINKLDSAVGKLGITHKPLPHDSKDETIGYLCGFKGFDKSDSPSDQPLDKQCLVLSGIQRKQLDTLLKNMKTAGLFIPLKAMVTPSNQSWKLIDLVNELQKEHEFMAKRK